MAADTQTLLQRYVRDHDDDSFRLLAEQYLGLIFHTALRQTGNHALSQEISQSVLCDLAKKAPSLSQQSRDLGPWLHRATIYQSSKAIRSEQTQQKWKSQLPEEADEKSESIQEALPHLDEALNKLSSSERRILILHFYDKLTFPKIAALIGKTPAATQKQSRRALEKLCKILSRKGVTLSSVGLASIFSSQFAKAAPPNIPLSVPVAGGSSSLASFFAIKLSKGAIVASTFLLALPLAFQRVQIATKQRQLEIQMATATKSPNRQRSIGNRAGGKDFSKDLDSLARELYLAKKTYNFISPDHSWLPAFLTNSQSQSSLPDPRFLALVDKIPDPGKREKVRATLKKEMDRRNLR